MAHDAYAQHRSSLRIALFALLVLAHLGVAVLLDRNRPARPAPRAPGLLTLDLQPPARPTIERQAPTEPRLPLPMVVPIQPPRLEISSSTATPPTQVPAVDDAAAAAQARPAPLNLALPSPASPALPASAPQPWRNPALSDPRANTRRADYAARMADTLGTDASLREESLGPGRHRFKQGTTCVETAESRIALIDPMGATMRGSPQLVTTCK